VPPHRALSTPLPNARLTISRETASHAGLTIEVAVAAEGAREVRALGRVIDPLPLIDAAQARAAAASALAAAQSEYARVSKLHAHDLNASARDLESAQAGRDRAAADFASAAARLALIVGPASAAPADLAALTARLAGGQVAVARIDLPAGDRLPSPAQVLSLTASSRDDTPIAARVLGPAPTTDPLLQGEAYLLLLEHDPPSPGTSLVVTLRAEQRVRAGVAVPRAAIVWYDSDPLAFVEVKPDVFERRTLELHEALGNERWLVTAGIAPGERIVTGGAQQLLSTQLLSAQPAD
jgi:hypothetical protein